jgi:predicted glycogen debranching enzyme
MIPLSASLEWLEADGLGGVASGTVAGPRTRRYHALLLAATKPPAGRVVLVNGCEVLARRGDATWALSTQRYVPDVVHPDGMRRLASFENDPWPRWTYALEDGTRIVHELFVPQGCPVVVQSWSVEPAGAAAGEGAAAAGIVLEVRPLLSGRDFHALQRENAACDLSADASTGARVRFAPYAGLPPVVALSNGAFAAEPAWYRQFQYDAERERGLDAVEERILMEEVVP